MNGNWDTRHQKRRIKRHRNCQMRRKSWLRWTHRLFGVKSIIVTSHDHLGVSSHHQFDSLFVRQIVQIDIKKKTLSLWTTGLLWRESIGRVTDRFPSQRVKRALPCRDVTGPVITWSNVSQILPLYTHSLPEKISRIRHFVVNRY